MKVKKVFGNSMTALGAMAIPAGLSPSLSSSFLGIHYANDDLLTRCATQLPVLTVVCAIITVLMMYKKQNPTVPGVLGVGCALGMFGTWIAGNFMIPDAMLGETLSGRLILATNGSLEPPYVHLSNFGFMVAGIVLGCILISKGMGIAKSAEQTAQS
ncbi:MAG: hypothetical protein JSS50_00455 [Proteobacteria bacterium]|nr:hypothetical protein [Pseudomonadota bacterium]